VGGALPGGRARMLGLLVCGISYLANGPALTLKFFKLIDRL
jgi:hypothetical protein